MDCARSELDYTILPGGFEGRFPIFSPLSSRLMRRGKEGRTCYLSAAVQEESALILFPLFRALM